MSCPDCFRGTVHAHSETKGAFETLHGIKTYVTKGEPGKSASTIIYFPDLFSLRLVNNLQLADTYAARTGCTVLIPDVVYGGGADPALMPTMEVAMGEANKPWSLGGMLQQVWALASLLPSLVPVLLWAHPSKAYARSLQFARDVRAALPAGGKLGVCGFCWGGWVSSRICAEATAAGGSERLVDAQFCGHPSYLEGKGEMIVDAVTKFKVPYSCAVAELDFQLSKEVAAKVEAEVREKAGAEAGVYEFKLYKGAAHGFCVRPKQDEPNTKGCEEATEQAVAWFNKYLN